MAPDYVEQFRRALLLSFLPAVEARLRELEKTVYGGPVSPCLGKDCALKNDCYRPQAGTGKAFWPPTGYDPEAGACPRFLAAAPFRVARQLQERMLTSGS